MTRNTWIAGGALLALFVGCSSTSSDKGNPGGPGGPGGGPLGICSSSSPCPSGEFCFNGICAYGCTNDSNCSANQYCDTGFSRTCQNKSGPAGCSADSDCASNQACVGGLCSYVPPQPVQCTPPPGPNDGCDMNSVCIAGQGGQPNKCLTFAPCGKDGSCPVGAYGAVCNDGYLQGKGRFCMPGLCKDATNCPSGDSCVPLAQGAPLGACSNGGTGQVCDATHACQNGLSCQSAPGFSGVCAPGLPSFDAGGGGSGQSGSPCITPMECASGVCNQPAMGQPGTCQ